MPFKISNLSAQDVLGAAPVVQFPNEPPPLLIVDQPLPEQLKQGLVILQYRTENLRIVPVFGSGALDVSPRIGHIHVTIDDGPWHWADASNEPLIINGLKPGHHHILIELADPTHKVIDQKKIFFLIPERS